MEELRENLGEILKANVFLRLHGTEKLGVSWTNYEMTKEEVVKMRNALEKANNQIDTVEMDEEVREILKSKDSDMEKLMDELKSSWKKIKLLEDELQREKEGQKEFCLHFGDCKMDELRENLGEILNSNVFRLLNELEKLGTPYTIYEMPKDEVVKMRNALEKANDQLETVERVMELGMITIVEEFKRELAQKEEEALHFKGQVQIYRQQDQLLPTVETVWEKFFKENAEEDANEEMESKIAEVKSMYEEKLKEKDEIIRLLRSQQPTDSSSAPKICNDLKPVIRSTDVKIEQLGLPVTTTPKSVPQKKNEKMMDLKSRLTLLHEESLQMVEKEQEEYCRRIAELEKALELKDKEMEQKMKEIEAANCQNFEILSKILGKNSSGSQNLEQRQTENQKTSESLRQILEEIKELKMENQKIQGKLSMTSPTSESQDPDARKSPTSSEQSWSTIEEDAW